MAVLLPEMIERYERLSASDVYDILNQMGYPNQAVSQEIRALDRSMAVAGPAFTINGEEAQPGKKEPALHLFREILPGSVLVLATNQHRISGPWGENTSLSARKRGGRGIVIDGGTRDVNEITAFGFPTFCRFVTPVYSGGRFVQTALQVPVEVAGQVDEKVVVEPEDFIVADADGVVVVPKALLEEVLLAAERLDEIEHQIRKALHLGEDREEVYRRYPKFDHVHKPGL